MGLTLEEMQLLKQSVNDAMAMRLTALHSTDNSKMIEKHIIEIKKLKTILTKVLLNIETEKMRLRSGNNEI